jgi:SAM-dependent methyltransferase
MTPNDTNGGNMARLEAQKKMGYYPTPDDTLRHIKQRINLSQDSVILDPCCGTGDALTEIAYGFKDRDEYFEAIKYGIELDTERASEALNQINNVVCGSAYEVVVRPLESFSMLYLNPPYDFEDGDRMEFRLLKHTHKWLMPGGLLVFLVPENLFLINTVRSWLARKYDDLQIYRFTRKDYPNFKQAALFGIKRNDDNENGAFPIGPYLHIEDSVNDGQAYHVHPGNPPDVFELKTITVEDIRLFQDKAMQNIAETISSLQTAGANIISPIFPLRRGHLVSLLMSGVLNGKLQSNGKTLVFKCFTDRQKSVREEDAKQITTDSYISGIRVMEKGRWYDVI